MRTGIDNLIEEIMNGEYMRDVLPESAFDFSGECQAQYFSHLRKNLESDTAHSVMTVHQDLRELRLLKEIRV